MEPSIRLTKLFNIFSGQPVEVTETEITTLTSGIKQRSVSATINDDDVCITALRASLLKEGFDLSVSIVTPGFLANDTYRMHSVTAYVAKDHDSQWRIQEFRMG